MLACLVNLLYIPVGYIPMNRIAESQNIQQFDGYYGTFYKAAVSGSAPTSSVAQQSH